jgi:hypothetical protein
MAKIIKTNGEEVDVQPNNGRHFSLKEMQDIVGGYIEVIPYGTKKLMVLNEEGKLLGLPENNVATDLVRGADIIVGDVLLCKASEVK